MLQFRLDLIEGKRVEQVAQLGGAKQFGEQGGVEGEGLGPTFREWRVAFIKKRRDVPEEQ